MAFDSWPNLAHANRSISLAENEALLTPGILTGLVGYDGTSPVYADSTGMQAKIRAGVKGNVRATAFANAVEHVVSGIPTVSSGAGTSRIDLIVARLNRGAAAPNAFTVTPVRIQGTAAASPVEPSPVRSLAVDGIYDLPLAAVTIDNGVATIAANKVANRAWWVSPSGLQGFSTARPPVESGLLFRENDTGILLLGTTGGTWTTLYRDTGWVTPSTPSGFSITGGFRIRRVGNLVTLSFQLNRTGATIASNAHTTILNLAGTPYVPSVGIFGVYHCGAPDHSSNLNIMPTGEVILGADFAHTIDNGASVWGTATWPVDE